VAEARPVVVFGVLVVIVNEGECGNTTQGGCPRLWGVFRDAVTARASFPNGEPGPNARFIWAPLDKELCYECHKSIDECVCD